MSESLDEMRHMLRAYGDLGEPTVADRAAARPRQAPQLQPCDKCGEEVLYSPPDAVFLHTRERIDEWDNRYFCRSEYTPRHRVVRACPNCEAMHDDVVPLGVDRVRVDACRMCGAALY